MYNKEKTDPESFFLKNNQLFFLSWGVISLRREMTPGQYSVGVIILLYTGKPTKSSGHERLPIWKIPNKGSVKIIMISTYFCFYFGRKFLN